MPGSGVGTRTLVVVGVGVVLVAQGVTVIAVHRMTSGRAAASAAVASVTRGPAVEQRRPPQGAPRNVLEPQQPSRTADDAQGGEPVARPVVKRPAPQTRWSSRPLDDAGQQFADEVGCAADDLRLLADERGHVTDAARGDLLAGREAATKIARDLGLDDAGEQRLGQIVTGFMLRRVTMRAAFQGTSVTPQAIDDAARADALAAAEANLDTRAKEALASALPGLPDLLAHLPSPAR